MSVTAKDIQRVEKHIRMLYDDGDRDLVGALRRVVERAEASPGQCIDCTHCHDDTADLQYCFCTNAESWYCHKAMPLTGSCEKFEPREE